MVVQRVKPRDHELTEISRNLFAIRYSYIVTRENHFLATLTECYFSSFGHTDRASVFDGRCRR